MSKKYTPWQEWEKEFVRENCKAMLDSEIAEEIGRTEDAVKGFRARNDIKTGRSHYFEKGHEPFNKGKKREEYMSEESIQKVKQTQFREGNVPPNSKYDGAITLRNDHGTNIKYLYYRESQGNWRLYHRKVYEDHYGEIPEGKIIVFKDGNQFNVDPENLEAITRAEHARRNRDWEKALDTMKSNGNHPSHNLTDEWIAGIIARGNENMKQFLLNERKDILSIARANYKLKRQVNEHS